MDIQEEHMHTMKVSLAERRQIEAKYCAEYERIHGSRPTLRYDRGWYTVNGRGNYRIGDMATMAHNLERRSPLATVPGGGQDAEITPQAK
jgi:hypothetical protein